MRDHAALPGNDTSRSIASTYVLSDVTIPILQPSTTHSVVPTKRQNTVDGILPSVDLLSRQYTGLMVHCIVSGAVFAFFCSVYQPLLVANLGVYQQDQFHAARRFFDWPRGFALAVGVAADCFLTITYRRKAAMVAGWILAMTAFGVLTMLSFYLSTNSVIYFGDATRAKDAIANAAIQTRPVVHGYAFLLLSVLADFGLQVAWIVSLVFVLEYAQRESLQVRGRLVALYLLLYYVAGAIVEVVAIKILHPQEEDGGLRASIDLSEATTAMTVVCEITVPFIMLRIPKNPLPRHTTPLLQQAHLLWRACQGSAMYRTLFFLLGYSLLIRSNHAQIRTAVAAWCGASQRTELYANAAKAIVACTTLVVWRRHLVNTNWRLLVAFSSAIQIVLPFLFTLTVAYIDAFHGQALYVFVSMLVEIPSVLVVLLVQLMATELAAPGTEGSTLGLLVTGDVLARLASPTSEVMLSSIVSLFDHDVDQVPRDAVAQAALAFMAVNALSLAFVPLLPPQKNHTLRLREESERSYLAACVLAIAFAVLLVFDGTANGMLMVGE